MPNAQKSGNMHWSGGNGSIIGVASHAINGGVSLNGFDGKVVSCTHGDGGKFLGVLLNRGARSSKNMRSVATLNSRTMVDMVCDESVLPGDKLNWDGQKLVKATGIAQFTAQNKAIADPFNEAQHLATVVVEETQVDSGIVVAQQAIAMTKGKAIDDGAALVAAQKETADLKAKLEQQAKQLEAMQAELENMKKGAK